MSQNITLQTLPNEVLVNILQYLRQVDLYSASLVAKDLNDVVSSVLYCNLIWRSPPGKSASLKFTENPGLAFQRRPWLRRSTQEVIIHADTWLNPHVEHACEELVKFPRLSRVHWVGVAHQTSFQKFIHTINQIDAIEEFRLPYRNKYTVPFFDPLMIKPKSLIVDYHDTIDQNLDWFEKIRTKLVSLYLLQNALNPSKLLNGCESLQNLVLENVSTLLDLMQPLQDLRKLRTLRISFWHYQLEPWANKFIDPFDLPYLHTLRIACEGVGSDATTQKNQLCQVYKCLASNSKNLVDLQFMVKRGSGIQWDPTGDIFLKSTTREHRNSLRSFALREMSISDWALTKLLHTYSLLDELEFTIIKKDLNAIIPILAAFSKLRVVRLSIAASRAYIHCPSVLEIIHLMQQSLQNLRQLWISREIAGVKRYDCWEARWIYDNDLCHSRRGVIHTQRSPDEIMGTCEKYNF